jgi:ribosome-binding protein aMBF1 (putative translation factor)
MSTPHVFPFMPAQTSFTADEVREMLWSAMKAQPGRPLTQKELAGMIGVSLPFLNDILRGKREPSGKVLEFLKLERVVRYEVRS